MRAQDDTPKEEFNDMERYSRLVEFFSSPDKTLGELYPFSPYTSNIPLSGCNIAEDAPSPSSSDEDFSATDLAGSQVSSGNESPIGRSILFDEPPSRLFLKLRPTRKTQQNVKDDGQNRAEGCQPDLYVGQRNVDTEPRRGRRVVGEVKMGIGARAQERISHRRESGESSRSSSSQERDSPERNTRCRSRRAKDSQSKGRQNKSRPDGSCQSRGSQERYSSEGTRKRRRSLDRADTNARARNCHSGGSEGCRKPAATLTNTPGAPYQPTASYDSRRSQARTHRPLESTAATAPSSRIQSPPQKAHTHQRAKEVSQRTSHPSRPRACGVSSQQNNESYNHTSSREQRIVDSHRRSNNPHRKKESKQPPYDEPTQGKNEAISSRPISASTRKHADETPCLCVTETTDAHSEYNRGRRFRTSNFTLPSSGTKSPTNLRHESTIGTSRASQQRKHLDRALINSPPDNSIRGLLFESAQSSAQMSSRSKVGQPVTPQPILSTRNSSSFAQSAVETPLQSIKGFPLGTSDTSSFFTCAMSPFQSLQPSSQITEEHTHVATAMAPTPFYDQINKERTNQEPMAKLPHGLERESKIKTKTSRDRSDQILLCSPSHLEQTSASSHARNVREIRKNDTVTFARESGNPAYSFGKVPSTPAHTTATSSQGTAKTDDLKFSIDISANLSQYQRSSCITQEGVLMSAAKSDRMSKKSGNEAVATLESNDTIAVNQSLHRASSRKSTSGSDVTEGDSVLDIEKFKQAVRSVKVPPELLEPLEESEDSENVLNILETISESPLEDCSEMNNSSNYADDEHVSADDAVQSHGSVNSAESRVPRDQLGDRSGSDLSDIQLHYAYGRNKNDQLELQWIKLEKVVDTASESSEGSVIDSPFNRQGESNDLQIRSMNLPNACTAQRHGDADRGPIATYLTLPAQSPTTGEDPELAIIVLHEENLSEHQKDVIHRLRRGMKRRRSRSSSEMITDVFGNQAAREQVDQPLIIPISDSSTDIGTAAGFAVIADSEPEVPLSVDVDVKSWFAKQNSPNESPILINQCPSKGVFTISNSSYSESHLVEEYEKHETSEYGYDATTLDYYAKRPLTEDQRSNSISDAIHKKSHVSRHSTSKPNAMKEVVSLERPKTAPPSNDVSKFRGVATACLHASSDKNSSQAKRKTRKRTPEESRTLLPDDATISPNLDGTPKQTHASVCMSETPTLSKNTGNNHSKSPVSRNKRGATNKQDNTVKVLLEPKSKIAWTPKEQTKNTENYSRESDNKSRIADFETAKSRHKRSSSAFSRRTDKSSSSQISKSPERPKTAPASSERTRAQTARGSESPIETASKLPENQDHKRSLSASARTPEQRQGKEGEGRRSEPKPSAEVGERVATAAGGNPKKPTGAEAQPRRPRTAPGSSERVNGDGGSGGGFEPLPPCNSCESSASTDSAGAGVPRYRLRRNISYLSEYRKTIDSLRAKCVMKDHMIDALLEELQLLSPAEDTLQRLRVKLSNCKLNGPPPRRDYSCCEVTDLLTRECATAADAGKGVVTGVVTETGIPKPASDEQCVCPIDFRIAGKVGCDCLLLTWKSAPNHETVAGYEVEVDGQLSQRVRSPTRTSALLTNLDLSREMSFTLRTLRSAGMPPCHPPLRILFAPSGDDWALDDPRPA